MKTPSTEKPKFSGYEVFLIAIVAFTQFTVIMDFMIMNPLSTILMPVMNLTSTQFGYVVAAYAIAAGISSFLSAGFSDKFDRKKMLLFFYTGFIVGTAFCALAPNFGLLLLARMFTGIFGGVIGSISIAIVTDTFAAQVRGRVMGFVQTAFAASMVLGTPIGFGLANALSWHAPFLMIVAISTIVFFIMWKYMKPVPPQTHGRTEYSPISHMLKTLLNPSYMRAYLATILMATGGFMIMPFSTAYSTNNLGIAVGDVPWLMAVSGIVSVIAGPLIGISADKYGRYAVFTFGTILSIIIMSIYTNLGITPFHILCILNSILFIGITSRIITVTAIVSTIPSPQDRGAFMSINSSLQQGAGGVGSIIAGCIVSRTPSGQLLHFPELGIIVSVTMLLALFFMLMLKRHLNSAAQTAPGTV